MPRFHVEVKITHMGSGNPVHESAYDADAEHTHRLLFAVDPLEAAYFSIHAALSHVLTRKRPRKQAHP